MIKIGTGPRCEPRGDLLLIQAIEKSSTRDAIATVWARRIGDDIYELQGHAPIAPGFNSHDIVKAVILPGQEMPTISELVRRSGCRTFHIKFFASTTADQREEILRRLAEFETTYEMILDRFYTVQTVPTSDHRTLTVYLRSLQHQGKLKYAPNTARNALMRCR